MSTPLTPPRVRPSGSCGQFRTSAYPLGRSFHRPRVLCGAIKLTRSTAQMVASIGTLSIMARLILATQADRRDDDEMPGESCRCLNANTPNGHHIRRPQPCMSRQARRSPCFSHRITPVALICTAVDRTALRVATISTQNRARCGDRLAASGRHRWRSGNAEACKAFSEGSIPSRAGGPREPLFRIKGTQCQRSRLSSRESDESRGSSRCPAGGGRCGGRLRPGARRGATRSCGVPRRRRRPRGG